MIQKGDSVLYYGEVYEVVQINKSYNLAILRNQGHEVYAWIRKCKKVKVDGQV